MGFWDFRWLPGIDWEPMDKKDENPPPKPGVSTRKQDTGFKLPGSSWDLKSKGDKDVSLPGSSWDPINPKPVLQQRFDPYQASRPTQRYLSSAGWKGKVSPLVNTGDTWVDATTARNIGPHKYALSKWQQEQAQGDYGVLAPEEPAQLIGDSFRTARANLSDYESLTPQQKNAMRFNEQLISAVEADRSATKPEDMAGYRSKVSEMFGTQGGSRTYAPNTMALLDKMGMGRLRGQDLDEYLSLDRAYDVSEIQNLKQWDTALELEPYKGYGVAAGSEVQTRLDQRQIDQAGSFIEKALADTGVRGWSEQARIDTYLGRRPAADQIPIGWLNKGEGRATDEENQKESLFQNMYDYLSSGKAQNLDEFWAATKARNFTDEDYNEIFDYFNLRSLEDDRIGVGEGYRTGAETRAFLGIGG